MTSPHGQIRAAIRESERRLRDSYASDAPRELALVEDTTSLLATVMSIAGGGGTVTIDVDKAGVPSGDVDALKLIALQLMGVRAVRVVRAARATLAVGYEAETRALDRILVELLAHRRAILDDPTGKAALDWLNGKARRGITARVAAMAPSDLYKNLSHDSHGDPAAALALIDPDTNVLALEPRRTPATRASLLMYAGFCRDQAVLISSVADIQLNRLPELEARIRAAWQALDSEGRSD